MVTFRKDIHLGRRVPIRPEDENECMLVSISENGLAVDKYGRKWRFLPWGDILAVPTITLADITVTEYPSLVGKTEAVWLVTLTHEDSECELWYKIVKNGEEPEAYSKYYEPILIKDNGIYQIVAKAKKEGEADSEVVRSDSFKVTRAVVSETYGKPIITEFTYADFPAAGDTKLPTFRYSQTGERRYTDGRTDALTPITEGATCNFYGMDGLTPSTGGLTVGKSSLTYRHNVGTVYVAVTMNGMVSDTASATVYQAAAEKWNNSIRFTKFPQSQVEKNTVLVVGTDIEAIADSGEIRYYYRRGSTKTYFTTSVTVTQDMIIGAEVAESEYYKGAYTEAQVTVRGIEQVYYGWGIDENEFLNTVDMGDGADLLVPASESRKGSLYSPNTNIGGQISNMSGDVIWIAFCTSSRPNIVITQNGIPATIEWTLAGTTARWNGEIYNFLYVSFRGSATLQSITF